jgi:hypothetical protein
MPARPNGIAVELTEFSDLDPDTLHLVKRGANGFPTLLAKSIAVEIAAAASSAAFGPVFEPPSLPGYVRKQVAVQLRRRALKTDR